MPEPTILPDYEAGEDVRAPDGSRGPLQTGDPALPVAPGVDEAIEVAPPATAHEEVLVLDFGGQYSQLIARRIRECGVYAELLPHDLELDRIRERAPAALVLSGGPASVYSEGAPQASPRAARARDPGARHLLRDAGHGARARRPRGGRRLGRVRAHRAQPRGRWRAAARGAAGEPAGWMSHRDSVFAPPPGFDALAASPGSPVAALRGRRAPALRDPVPPRGRAHAVRPADPGAFPHRDRRLRADWSPASVIDEQVERIRAAGR